LAGFKASFDRRLKPDLKDFGSIQRLAVRVEAERAATEIALDVALDPHARRGTVYV
jgi:hypothetical protein